MDAIQNAVERFGGLDIVVNNAGVSQRASVEDLDDEGWHSMIEINLTGPARGGARCCAASARPWRWSNRQRRVGGRFVRSQKVRRVQHDEGGAARAHPLDGA